MDSKAVPAVHDGTEPLNEAHTYAERLKRVFAYDKSPETIALDAQMAGGTRGPQTEDAPYTVSVVRYASVTHSPAGWRQARPHWGILVDDTFYHVIVGSNASKPCVLDWSSVDAGEPIDISIPVGTTTMAHRYIVRTLKHIIGHFGTSHTIYWHCIDFMRTAIVALCNGPLDHQQWDHLLTQEDDMRAGILSVNALPKMLPALVTGNDADEVLSGRIMASTLPQVFASSNSSDGGPMGSTVPRCCLC